MAFQEATQVYGDEDRVQLSFNSYGK